MVSHSIQSRARAPAVSRNWCLVFRPYPVCACIPLRDDTLCGVAWGYEVDDSKKQVPQDHAKSDECAFQLIPELSRHIGEGNNDKRLRRLGDVAGHDGSWISGRFEYIPCSYRLERYQAQDIGKADLRKWSSMFWKKRQKPECRMPIRKYGALAWLEIEA